MEQGICIAVTRTVKPGCEEEFEKSILTFFADSLQETGNLGVQLLKPLLKSNDRTYGILRSFASETDCDAFYLSDRFLQWEKVVEPLVEGDYSRRQIHGLEAFFRNPDIVRYPLRWKMALLTWLGVWPAVYVVSAVVAPHLSSLPRWLATGVITFIVVLLLTWAVMPLLTWLVRPFLLGPIKVRLNERNRS